MANGSASTTENEARSGFTAIVVIGGNPPLSAVTRALPEYQFVIAADSGLHAARFLGLAVNVVIGDMDSVDPTILDDAQNLGVAIERSPRDKDATDTELALLYAVEQGATRIVVVTGGGGRLDHQLGVLNVLLHPKLSTASVEMFWDKAHVVVLRGMSTAVINGRAGEEVGLLAMGGAATGVTTSGLRWALDGEMLESYSTRGVSNELVGTEARVSLGSGTLFIIRPNALGARNEN